VKKGWKVKKLGEVCQVIAGQSPESKYYNHDGDGLPFYQGKKEFTEKFIGQPTTWTTKITKESFPGDILMSVRAPVGPVNFSNEKICIGRGLAAIRASDLINKEFLFYFLVKHKNEIVGNIGAVFDSISKAQIENILITLPQSLSEQQQIVRILDEAFDGINTIKANTEKNLQNARELFESYLNSIFVDQENKSQSKKLESLCDLIVDCEHKTAPTQETGFPSIRTPNIGKGKLILEGVYRVSETTYREWTKRAVPKSGDLVLAREAPAGNVAIIPDNLKVCLGQRTVLIRPSADMFISKFLMYLLLSKNMQKLLLSHSRGATVTHINMKDIRNLPINFFPPISEQKAIVEKLDQLSTETKRLEKIYQQKLTDLEELKKSILQQAFNGELT
jgi:type I restriction enzyme S subunit